MEYFEKYMQQLSLALWERTRGKKIIYLDLKYWILLRDRDRVTDAVQKKVSEQFIRLLNSGRCIFPISETTFWEIMKQSEDTRKLTFEVVDRFSQGLTIVNSTARLRIEFYYWMQSFTKSAGLIEPVKLIWTNIHLEIGRIFYSHEGKTFNETRQKELLDFVCRLSISDVFKFNNQSFPAFTYKDNIDAFNENKGKYAHENKTFDEMFLSELGGMLDACRDEFNGVMSDRFFEETGRKPTETERMKTDQNAWCKLIYSAFKLKKITTELPLLKIFPTLHGVMRWNRNRKYKDGNDTMDIMHAATALPYCNYFFTEKELHTMIRQQELDISFDCIVESAPEKILLLLEAI